MKLLKTEEAMGISDMVVQFSLLLSTMLATVVKIMTVSIPVTGVSADIASEATDCLLTSLPSPVPLSEEIAMAANPGRAERDRKTLQVGFAKFEDVLVGPEFEPIEWFRYAGRYENFSLDVVLSGDFDSIGWVIVDQESRTILEVSQIPVPGPDGGAFFFPSSFSAEEDGAFGAITIRERHSDGWKEVARIKTNHVCDVKWVDALTIGFRERSGYSKYDPGNEQFIIKTSNGWSRVRKE